MVSSKASKYSYEAAIPLLGVESLWWILRANMNVVTAGRMADLSFFSSRCDSLGLLSSLDLADLYCHCMPCSKFIFIN